MLRKDDAYKIQNEQHTSPVIKVFIYTMLSIFSAALAAVFDCP